MEIKIETLDDDKIKVNVEVDSKDVDSKINATYRSFAKKYNFPGFRKGKAPRPVIDNAFGKQVILAQVTEDLINDTYPKVIEEKKIFPVGSPDFGDPDMVEQGKPLTFEFTQAVKPEYKLTSYDPVSIEIPEAGASDEEIEEQVNGLVDRYENYVDADDSQAIDEKMCADLVIKATKEDGESVAGLSSETAFYAPETGIYSEDFGKELIGLKAGEKKKFTLDIPEDETSVFMSDVAGQKIDFDVECKKVKVISKPELTDEWVKETLGFDDIKDMKEKIAESIKEQKADVIPRIKENECAQQLIERLEGDVPDSMVEQIESELLQDFFTQLQRQGISFDNYLMMQGIDNDQFKEDVKHQASDNAKRDLALDAWAAQNSITATDEDVTLEFERAGLEDPKKVEDEWRDQGRLYLIREGIIRRKAMEDVMEKAKVKELSFADYRKKIEKEDE